jgi:hypothetical protein
MCKEMFQNEQTELMAAFHYSENNLPGTAVPEPEVCWK